MKRIRSRTAGTSGRKQRLGKDRLAVDVASADDGEPWHPVVMTTDLVHDRITK